MFKHILVPTDGSQLSEETARSAVSFAKEVGARITALCAKRESPAAYYSEGMVIEATLRNKIDLHAEQEAQQNLDFVEKLCQDAGVSCTKLMLSRNIPYEAIIEAASNSGCDLIFMASHGRRGIGGLLIGSETHKVLTHSKIPVLVYR